MIRVSAVSACRVPLRDAASSVRMLVVPTAMTRPPATIKRTRTRGRVKTNRYYAYTANAVDPRTKQQLKRSWAVLTHGQRGAKQEAMQWRAAMVRKIDKWYRSQK